MLSATPTGTTFSIWQVLALNLGSNVDDQIRNSSCHVLSALLDSNNNSNNINEKIKCLEDFAVEAPPKHLIHEGSFFLSISSFQTYN